MHVLLEKAFFEKLTDQDLDIEASASHAKRLFLRRVYHIKALGQKNWGKVNDLLARIEADPGSLSAQMKRRKHQKAFFLNRIRILARTETLRAYSANIAVTKK